MLKYRPFVLIIGFLFGCGAWSVLLKPDWFWLCLSGLLLVVLWRKGWENFDRVTVIVFLFGMLIGVVRVFVSEIVYDGAIGGMSEVSGKEVNVCVVENPEFVDGKQKIIVKVSGFGNVLIRVPLYPAYKYGDELKVVASIEKAPKVDGFDYEEYLKMKGIFAVADSANIEVIGECGNPVLKVIYGLKKIFSARLNSEYPEPYASFVAGILIGERASIPSKISEMFTRIGVTHIVAISGYNISIIIASVSSMLGFLSRKKRALASIVFVFVFVLFVGAGSSVVRAGIMGILNLIGVYFGRGIVVAYAISLSACLMTFWSPKILIYDVSFQLSFLATIGIVYFSNYLKNKLRFVKPQIIKENLSVTLAAQLFTLPVILKNFGFVSWIAPFSNIVILPFIPLSMLLSFIGIFLLPFAFLNYVLLEVLFFIMRFFDFFMTL